MSTNATDVCHELQRELSQLLNFKLQKLGEVGINYVSIASHAGGSVIFCPNAKLARIMASIAKELYPLDNAIQKQDGPQPNKSPKASPWGPMPA